MIAFRRAYIILYTDDVFGLYYIIIIIIIYIPRRVTLLNNKNILLVFASELYTKEKKNHSDNIMVERSK